MRIVIFLLAFLAYGKTFSADLPPITSSKIVGSNEQYAADVILKDARRALVTDATVTIEQLFGRDPQATTWLYIGDAYDASGVGLVGDTIRIQIPAANYPLDSLYPAVDVTTTVTADVVANPNPERALATLIISDLSADASFKLSWKAQVIKDFSGVFIASKFYNEWGERTAWTVTTTGTTVINKAYDDVVRRGFATELARSPNNPRQGILAISGSVSVTPGEVADTFNISLKNSANSPAMNVNGSVTPVAYFLYCDPIKDIYVQNVKIYGQGNGIKFGQFLNISTLTNGILVQIRSSAIDSFFTEEPIKKTDDFKHSIPDTLANYKLDIQAGRDDVTAFREYENPFIIRKCGTNGTTTEDYIKATIRDNVSSLLEMEMSVYGFKKEP